PHSSPLRAHTHHSIFDRRSPDFFSPYLFSSPSDPRHHLPSFPTRRSSDLPVRVRRGERREQGDGESQHQPDRHPAGRAGVGSRQDRKSTRLNSSHVKISYAVFCLKKKTITLLQLL